MGATESGVFALAREGGNELDVGETIPWLSNLGHLNPVLADAVPVSTVELLRTMHQQLGGDENALAGKRAGSSPRPDFFLRSAALIVEVDEIQHFTTDRLRTLELYPEAAQLAFNVGEYRTLISQWSSVADNYRVAKSAVDFPHPGGRRAQRAYFDAVRDLVAPSFGWTVCRVPAPECNAVTATARLTDRLAQLSKGPPHPWSPRPSQASRR